MSIERNTPAAAQPMVLNTIHGTEPVRGKGLASRLTGF